MALLYAAAAGGATRGEYEIVLRFDAEKARYVRERGWHPSQSLDQQEGGGVILKMTVAGEGDPFRWILSHGSHVEVLRAGVAAGAGGGGVEEGGVERRPPRSSRRSARSGATAAREVRWMAEVSARSGRSD